MSSTKTPAQKFDATIEEWLSTEKVYLSHLTFVRDVVIPSFSTTLTESEIQSFFANIGEIAQISEELSHQLAMVPLSTQRAPTDDNNANNELSPPSQLTLGEILLQMMPTFEAYLRYIKEKGPTDELFEKFQKKTHFKSTQDKILTSTQAVSLNLSPSLGISYFTILPTSRLARYGLFLSELIKNCTDGDQLRQLKDAQTQLGLITKQINLLIQQKHNM